jgi:hypothetical protein
MLTIGSKLGQGSILNNCRIYSTTTTWLYSDFFQVEIDLDNISLNPVIGTPTISSNSSNQGSGILLGDRCVGKDNDLIIGSGMSHQDQSIVFGEELTSIKLSDQFSTTSSNCRHLCLFGNQVITDRSIKAPILDLTKLRVRSYRVDGADTFGLIAEEIDPQFAVHDQYGELVGIDYDKLLIAIMATLLTQ